MTDRQLLTELRRVARAAETAHTGDRADRARAVDLALRADTLLDEVEHRPVARLRVDADTPLEVVRDLLEQTEIALHAAEVVAGVLSPISDPGDVSVMTQRERAVREQLHELHRLQRAATHRVSA